MADGRLCRTPYINVEGECVLPTDSKALTKNKFFMGSGAANRLTEKFNISNKVWAKLIKSPQPSSEYQVEVRTVLGMLQKQMEESDGDAACATDKLLTETLLHQKQAATIMAPETTTRRMWYMLRPGAGRYLIMAQMLEDAVGTGRRRIAMVMPNMDAIFSFLQLFVFYKTRVMDYVNRILGTPREGNDYLLEVIRVLGGDRDDSDDVPRIVMIPAAYINHPDVVHHVTKKDIQPAHAAAAAVHMFDRYFVIVDKADDLIGNTALSIPLVRSMGRVAFFTQSVELPMRDEKEDENVLFNEEMIRLIMGPDQKKAKPDMDDLKGYLFHWENEFDFKTSLGVNNAIREIEISEPVLGPYLRHRHDLTTELNAVKAQFAASPAQSKQLLGEVLGSFEGFDTEMAVKIKAVFDDIKVVQGLRLVKTVVLLSSEMGLAILAQMLLDAKIGFIRFPDVVSAESERFRKLFNDESNSRGQIYPIALLNPSAHTEGMFLANVRRFVIPDITFGTYRASWTLFHNNVRNIISMCSLNHLPETERSVMINIYIAVVGNKSLTADKSVDIDTLDQANFKQLEEQMNDHFGKGKKFRDRLAFVVPVTTALPDDDAIPSS